ncbi:12087_t:CDS:10 [Funneliformis caledonium]|uniref:12087_t:CDS:1 n=1 Tax=Funneliformis caledonium TaxID=1117310 RepID=A0A9N8VVD8_9GLOM|nr:12087_t:CDS:10 [Funneliformis caledonium]
MSLDDFRRSVLMNLGGEERVEVNQRLLIDKILARYSSEFVVYRELMQNSDDAKASSVNIIFETENPITGNNVTGNKITRILFKNDGFVFRPQDWDRLKRIAEGNPDEQKIGAFGVGFYSLFSVCENPFVSSGGQGMAFYWRGDHLFAGQGPTGDEDQVWTTFLMDMREPAEFPNIEKFTRFLVNSLQLVIELSKRTLNPRYMNSSGFDTISPQKLFHLTSVDIRDVMIDVKRLVVPNQTIDFQTVIDCEIIETSICLTVISGNLDVTLSREFSAEMERMTKKRPPGKTTVQMLFARFDDTNHSQIFNDLVPYPKQGNIYIGFPTHQTTGCCTHLAARVIPTVERESIDLVDKTLAVYNKDLLCVAGILCRIVYEDDFAQIKQLYNDLIAKFEPDEKILSIRRWLEKRAAHSLDYFTFKPSTPNPEVGRIIESQFFSCSRRDLSILSTNGVLPISDVRIPKPEMAGFIKNVPVVPKILLEQCELFFKKATSLIKELTFEDVLFELKSRSLCENEMVELLKWWSFYRSNGNHVDSGESELFMQLATVYVNDQIRPLNTFDFILNPGIIPPDVDLPAEVLPFSISKTLQRQDLEKWLGWSTLPLIYWAKFIVNNPNLELIPAFAEKIHHILEKNLKIASSNDKEIIRQLFIQKDCVPTKFGMKNPIEAYFQDVNLFPDLPTIQFSKPSSVHNIMKLLGVRKVVDLQIIFSRLGQKDCDHMQLVKYLISELDHLKENDMMKLKITPIWPRENLVESKTKGKFRKAKLTSEIRRYVAYELYAPVALHREFDLPILDWRKRWARSTPEGKLLIDLGLREYPTLQKIIELAAPPTDPNIREKALKYFIDNFKEKYSKEYKPSDVKVAFLPCSSPNIYAKPTECFINIECTIMKFKVIRQDLRFNVGQFGVCQNPSGELLKERLIEDTPQDEETAKSVFEYLQSQQGSFTTHNWLVLGDLNFIPIRDSNRPDVIIKTNPRSCFFDNQEKSLNDFFTKIDFGQKANKFLQSCGVKILPYAIDYAELLVKSSHVIWGLMEDNVEKYLNILKRIAFDYHYLSRYTGLLRKMSTEPILVAITSGQAEGRKVHCRLASANEIYINDDTIYQQVFNPFTAPEDCNLKNLYIKLGCKSLRNSVTEVTNPGYYGLETENSRKLKETIMERASLFYHDYSESEIKRDAEWLKQLKIKEVERIEANYTLKTTHETKSKSISTCLKEEWTNSWVLFVTPNTKSLDISQHLVRSIYVSHKWKDIFNLNTLLITPLSSLESMGYPIDCIPNLKRSVEKYNQKGRSTGTVTEITPAITQNLRNSLQDVINACRAHSGSSLHNQASVKIVDESQPSYCDIIPGHSLYFVGTLQGIKIYNSIITAQSINLFQTHAISLNRFVNLLRYLVEVFQLAPEVVHIFYDNNSNSVAFNRDRSLFFNLNYYIGLHGDECQYVFTNNAMNYWFMTVCHELAHNIVLNHDSKHETSAAGTTISTETGSIANQQQQIQEQDIRMQVSPHSPTQPQNIQQTTAPISQFDIK